MTHKVLDAQNPLTHEVEVMDERGTISKIRIPSERSLTVYLNGFELITLMTLGAAPEALALGYLRNQRLINSPREIASIQVLWDIEAAHVVTKVAIPDLAKRISRRVVTSGCGQGTVFGGLMDDIDNLRLNPTARIKQSVIYAIVRQIREQSSVYKQARSVHGCALFTNAGQLIYFSEDVGRHNAVDAIAGLMWQNELTVADHIFYTTGRLTSEMVIKSGQMGFPFILSRSGTTQMGRNVALDIGMTLLARCTGTHFLACTNTHRLDFDISSQMNRAEA